MDLSSARRLAACLPIAATCACGPSAPPSDDPADYDVTPGTYRARLSAPTYVVPSSALPSTVTVQASNNNLDLELFEDRRFLAFRTGPTHFASPDVELVVVSSKDEGLTWDREFSVKLGADIREPRFLVMNGVLSLFYFEAGTDMFSFTPKRIWRVTRESFGRWGTPTVWSDQADQVLWELKVRGGVAYMGTYRGTRYTIGDNTVGVGIGVSTDGVSFAPLDVTKPVLYRGGVSEIAFDFDRDGGMWILARNEDGDATGFGSLVCYAPAGKLSAWECPGQSDPERRDSPEMFRHGDDFYVIARRDLGGPYDQGRTDLKLEDARTQYQLAYWQRPKRTTLYKLNKELKRLDAIVDLPSAGDTAYPAARRLGPHRWLVANYTSPPDDPDRSWVEGQTSAEGTWIYTLTIDFELEGS